MKILFVHALEGNAYELFKAFKRLENVEIEPLFEKNHFQTKLISRIRFKMKIPIDHNLINKKLLKKDLSDFDVVFIVKGIEILPSTLKNIKNKYPHLKLVNWSLDDMYAWHNRSLFYTLGIKFYDLIITTKSYNINELKKLGAKKILFVNQAFSKDIHIPCDNCTNKKYANKIIFIGYPEKERFESIQHITKAGYEVHIYGYPNIWKRKPYSNANKNVIIHNKALYGKEYACALSCAAISLCFLRKANRDLQTSRSIEIPACKGFMLAERTSEHLALFEEDKEAVYFSDNEELVEKVRYYMEHEEERRAIAKAGYERCLASGYSYDDRAAEMVQEISKL